MSESIPLTMPAAPGTHIETAIREALALAALHASPVQFEFNGALVVVQPGEPADAPLARWNETMDANAAAYRASPAGIKAAQEATEWLARLQALHDELMAKLPGLVTDEAALVQWCDDFSKTDHMGIKRRNYPGAIALMEAAAWRNNDMVGQHEEIEAQPSAMARYIVGQAINCMAAGMAPLGVIEKFVADYRRMRAGVTP